MANDSTTPGYLTPSSSPAYDDSLDVAFHDAVVGIVGIVGTLVRPRWQPEPVQQPDFGADWCAFGVTRSVVDVFAYKRDDVAGESIERDELLTLLFSFYGPHAHANCERFRDGLEVDQNRDALLAAGIGVVEVDEAVIAPAFQKEKWVRKVDVTAVFRRRTSRPYGVLAVASATGQLLTDGARPPVPIVVTPPA